MADPLVLTPDIKALIAKAIDDGAVMLLAAVDADGKPLLSYRGSVSAFSDDQLSIWARNPEGGTITALETNPNVALAYRSPSVPVLQFAGRARVTHDTAELDRAYAIMHERERAADPDRKGRAIIVDLDAVRGVLGFDNGKPIFVNMAR
jgi:hypothetical protein